MTDIVIRLRLEASVVALEAAETIENLRERLAFAEHALAIIRGTLEEARAARGDEPFSVTQDVPPTTPR